MDTHKFHSINDTLIILLPKAYSTPTIKDYRPISLIHILGKLISKVLATKLVPRNSEPIHLSQSAFIKERMI
jgi:hypothetical protein